jgi:bifunctional non-homologous end joining protein LigD
MLARRDAAGVRLLTRNAFDWAGRYPGITSAVNGLRCRSCLIDGEVVICGEDGIPIFNRLREGKQVKGEALLFAFDLIELDGRDLRREPIEARKATLAKLLRKAAVSLQLNEHIIEPGDLVFKHACRMGLEGIVSKRLGSTYRSGRSNHWLKMKNPTAPAVKARGGRGLGPLTATVFVARRLIRYDRRDVHCGKPGESKGQCPGFRQIDAAAFHVGSAVRNRHRRRLTICFVRHSYLGTKLKGSVGRSHRVVVEWDAARSSSTPL